MTTAVHGKNGAVQTTTHVYRGDGVRLYGLDAEIELKQQAKRDVNFEKQLGQWIEQVIGEKLKFPDDLIESLRSGIVLCKLLNAIIPGTIKNINTTRDTALHHMENIGLYLKACWVVGIQSSDLFVSSDLYLRKNVNAVVQNLLAISRSTQSIDGYKGPVFNGIPGTKTNNNIQPAKKWDPITFGGPVYVTDIEARSNNQSPPSNDCNKCGNEKICIKCNPPQPPTIVTNVNSILDEKERAREKEREKELLLKIQNLSNALKEKDDGLKLLNQDLEKQRRKQLEDEKQYKDLIENQKNQILSKENLITSLNKTNSSLIMLTTTANSNTPSSNSIPIPTTTSTATTNGSSGSSLSTTNGNKSNRNSGVFQNIALYNNKSTISTTTPSSGSTIISSSAAASSSSILSKCTRCNFTTTKTIKYCSSCGELLKKETTSTPNSSTFNKPPITSKSNIVISTPSVINTTVTTPPQSTSPSYINNNSNNNDEKIKTLITTMKQQEDVITNLNQQIKSDRDQFEKEKKQQKQIIDNQQILLNQKEQDLKKALTSNSSNSTTTQSKSSFITPSTNKGQFVLSGELKSINQDSNNSNNIASFSRPIGNNSNNTTTISNKELEILREKIKNLEIKLNDEISKSKQKDSQISILNEKVSSFNNKLKRPPPANSANKGSQIVVVGRKRFNTLKPDAVDLTTLVDATLVHLTTILYSKPIEFYQVNSLKDLFKTEMGRRRFAQILSMTLKKVPSLQMNESSFEFLLFLISCALQEMNLSKDNDIQSAKILFHSSDLLYRINPKGQFEYMKDYIRSANVYRDVTFWNEYYWSELSKRHRKVYSNVDTLDKEIINNLLAYFGTNMIYFSVPNEKVKSFITEIGQQHNLSNTEIDSIINSIKDSPLYSSTTGSTINVVSTATATSSSKKDKDKDKKKK